MRSGGAVVRRPRSASPVAVLAGVGAALVVILIIGLLVHTAGGTQTTGVPKPSDSISPVPFRYGYDLVSQSPLTGSPSATESARGVMRSIPGSIDDVSIMGWGASSPEPSPGAYSLSSIAARLRLVEETGGTPVITLCGAPDWMKGGASGSTNPAWIARAPEPDHYEDFARLSAHIAEAFPQVKYFVVWNELKGFWDSRKEAWNAAGYTRMYNDVYRAIKQVRPEALVGGPYAPMATDASIPNTYPQQAITGHWGNVSGTTVTALLYWLRNEVGADFVAIDGNDVSDDHLAVSPLLSVRKYAAVDKWLRAHTRLPIWWMESHIEPPDSGWTQDQAASVRLAAVIMMSTSGAAVGLQWQPQQQTGWSDIGLWSSTLEPGGGKATALTWSLRKALPVIRGGLSVTAGQPAGVLVATGPAGSVALNTTKRPELAFVSRHKIHLAPGEAWVLPQDR